jgi:hypothetical protein
MLNLFHATHDSLSVTRSSNDVLESMKLCTGLHPDIVILRPWQKVLWIVGVVLPKVSSFLPTDHFPPVLCSMSASPKHLPPLKVITTNIPINRIAIICYLEGNIGMYAGEGSIAV